MASDLKAQVKLQEEAVGDPQKDTCHLQGKHVELESWGLPDVSGAANVTKIFYVYTYRIYHPHDPISKPLQNQKAMLFYYQACTVKSCQSLFLTTWGNGTNCKYKILSPCDANLFTVYFHIQQIFINISFNLKCSKCAKTISLLLVLLWCPPIPQGNFWLYFEQGCTF